MRYQTHALTPLLRAGANAVGILSGHVMDASPSVVALLAVRVHGEVYPRFWSTASDGWLGRDSYVTADSAWATTVDWSRVEAPLPPPLPLWRLGTSAAVD